MYRAVAVLVLAAALIGAGTASAARIYVGALPGGGKIKVRTWHGHARVKLRVPTTCNNGEHSVYRDKFEPDVRRHHFRIVNFLNGDTGDGAGFSETFEMKGRVRRARVTGRLEYQAASYSIHNDDDDVSCSSGHLRYTAWRRR
jgi:hypothetical protein